MKAEYDFSNAQRGAVVQPKNQTKIALYLDDDILEALQAKGDQSGQGYQVLINQVLQDYLESSQNPLNEESLRRIIREELQEIR